MTNKRKQKRVSDTIHQTVSELLLRRIKDPRVLGVTITDVEITADLQQATIWYSLMGSEEEAQEAAEGLKSANGFLRSQVAGKLGLFHAPELIFKRDHSLERVARIESILEQIALERENNADPDPASEPDS